MSLEFHTVFILQFLKINSRFDEFFSAHPVLVFIPLGYTVRYRSQLRTQHHLMLVDFPTDIAIVDDVFFVINLYYESRASLHSINRVRMQALLSLLIVFIISVSINYANECTGEPNQVSNTINCLYCLYNIINVLYFFYI